MKRLIDFIMSLFGQRPPAPAKTPPPDLQTREQYGIAAPTPAPAGAEPSPPSPFPLDGRGVASEASRGEGFDLPASIAQHAARVGIEAAVGAAIFEVESGGRMFVDLPEPHGRKVTARFEVHKLWSNWGAATANKSTYDFWFRPRAGTKNHQYYNAGNGDWITIHVKNFEDAQWREWEAIRIAASIAGEETALRCASFGAGQIMGVNHARCGYPSATAMVEAFVDPDAQVAAVFDFIATDHRLARAAREHAWFTFASFYNGPGNAEDYSRRLAAAYQKHAGGRS